MEHLAARLATAQGRLAAAGQRVLNEKRITERAGLRAIHPDRLALADALEAEHALIERLLTAIDAAAADPDYGYQRLGDITDELAAKLIAHLTHEETDGLVLIGVPSATG